MIFLIGKLSKKFRIWYWRRTGKWYWGLVSFLMEIKKEERGNFLEENLTKYITSIMKRKENE